METFEINGVAYSVERAKLKLWIALEQIQREIEQAVASKDADNLSENLCLHVATACDVSMDVIKDAPWIEIATAYATITTLNTAKLKLPFMQVQSQEQDDPSWEYKGRTWYAYAHILAQEYGWCLEYIAELDVDDAFALIQEVMVSKQLEREWDWSLSEKSVGKIEGSDKYQFIPLPRPIWMQRIPKEPKKVMIPKALLPVGNVISWKDRENVVH